MKKEQVREKLLSAAMELLTDSDSAGDVTVRQIAARAGVNPAMINYCFGSKEELFKTGVDRLMEDAAGNPLTPDDREKPVLTRLWNMLWRISKIVMKFSGITKPAIPYIMMSSDIAAPLYVLPYMREYFGDTKSEQEIRLMAYQMLSFMQLIYYRAEDFTKYSGFRMDEDGMKHMMEIEFKIFFGEVPDNE